jgi:hypothetical protein
LESSHRPGKVPVGLARIEAHAVPDSAGSPMWSTESHVLVCSK